jgi:hypothetical protein
VNGRERAGAPGFRFARQTSAEQPAPHHSNSSACLQPAFGSGRRIAGAAVSAPRRRARAARIVTLQQIKPAEAIEPTARSQPPQRDGSAQ